MKYAGFTGCTDLCNVYQLEVMNRSSETET